MGRDDSFGCRPANAIAHYDTVTRTFTVAQGMYTNPHTDGWPAAANLS